MNYEQKIKELEKRIKKLEEASQIQIRLFEQMLDLLQGLVKDVGKSKNKEKSCKCQKE